MSEPAQEAREGEPGVAQRIADVGEQFELALQASLQGGPRPDIDLLVAGAAQAEREQLKEALERIKRIWHERHASRIQATIDSVGPSMATDTRSGSPAPTIELVEAPASGSPAQASSSQTFDLAVGVAAQNPPSLVAPAASADEATGIWEPGGGQPVNPNLAFTIDQVAAARRARAETSLPTVPDYELLSELGRGGMGVVYKAVHAKLHRVVALKMVLAGAHANPEQLARFAIEAEAVASLQHPNIVQIYEIGEQNGLPFFSLEFVDGQPLDKRLAGKPQAPREAARLMEPIARAMQFAHERGIVHRDLKPANVLLTRDGAPKITDFGLAKKLESDSSQTKSGMLMGTPSYMAPEQARGETNQAGPPADIHSLGAMLYEMLVGRPPYLGSSPVETVMQVIHSEPLPPRKLMPRLSRDVETICLKCLQKEPVRRYASAGELADDLKRFLAGEPILARPISAPERAWRWCRRNPRIAALSAAVFLLLATASVAMGKLAVNSSQQRQASEETRKLAGQRLEQATKTIAAGDARRAADVLRGRDLRLSTAADLADVRHDWETLQSQVEVYAEFKRLLAEAHFAGLSGNRDDQLKARETLQDLLKLYQEIKDHAGRAAAGLPPLDKRQQQLFTENEFEAFLLAAFTEYHLFGESDDSNQRSQALRRAIDWLNEAEKILPNTRALYIQRAGLWGALGDQAAGEADIERAKTIQPASAVDHFWRGLAEFMRAGGARSSGDTSKATQHYRAAIAEYSDVLRLNPRDFWGYTQWAACHLELGEFADAVIGTTAAIEIDPEHAMSYVNRAIAQLRLGKIDDALQDLAAALAIDAHCAEAYLNRALTELHLQQDAAALGDLDLAIESKPSLEEAWLNRAETYRRLKRHEEALSDLGHLIEIARDPPAARLRRAGFLRELGRRQEAEADYNAILQRTPENVDARRDRSTLRAEMDRLEDAVTDLDHLLRVNPDDAESLLRRGEWNRKLKRNEAALADYTQLIQRQRDPAANYRRRAEVYRDLGRASEAIDDYGQVVQLKPNDADAWFQRAALEFNTGRRAAARDDATKVIELAPKAPQPYQIRALANLANFKEIDASLADWRKLTELNPKDAMAHYYVGAIEMGRRNYPEAVAALDRAIELAPGDAGAHWARSQTLLFQKRYDDALAEINLLIEKLASNRPAALNSRGDVYRAMGRFDEAAADYRTFFQRKPARPDDEYLQAAVSASASLAGVLDLQGKREEARACYDRLVADHSLSAAALLERAQDRRNQGRFDDALADCDAAARLDAKSVLPGLARASIAAARGDPMAAVTEAENLLAGAASGDGHVLWAAARVWSLASAAAQAEENAPAGPAQRYADRAADLLADALGRGFHDLLYPEHNRLPLDPALAPVRRHSRVLELLGE